MFREEPKAKPGSLCSRLPAKRWGAKGARRSKFILLLKSWKKKILHPSGHILLPRIRLEGFHIQWPQCGCRLVCFIFFTFNIIAKKRARAFAATLCWVGGLL